MRTFTQAHRIAIAVSSDAKTVPAWLPSRPARDASRSHREEF